MFNKTDKGRAELQPRQRASEQRERAVLLVAIERLAGPRRANAIGERLARLLPESTL